MNATFIARSAPAVATPLRGYRRPPGGPGRSLRCLRPHHPRDRGGPCPAPDRHRTPGRLVPAAPSLLPPTELPTAPAHFAGRAEILRAVTAAVRARTAVAVHGMPGVGKTAVALLVAHRVAPDYPDGQLFVSLRRTGPGPVLRRVLRAFGDRGTVRAPPPRAARGRGTPARPPRLDGRRPTRPDRRRRAAARRTRPRTRSAHRFAACLRRRPRRPPAATAAAARAPPGRRGRRVGGVRARRPGPRNGRGAAGVARRRAPTGVRPARPLPPPRPHVAPRPAARRDRGAHTVPGCADRSRRPRPEASRTPRPRMADRRRRRPRGRGTTSSHRPAHVRSRRPRRAATGCRNRPTSTTSARSAAGHRAR